jgi:hypothetical protein
LATLLLQGLLRFSLLALLAHVCLRLASFRCELGLKILITPAQVSLDVLLGLFERLRRVPCGLTPCLFLLERSLSDSLDLLVGVIAPRRLFLGQADLILNISAPCLSGIVILVAVAFVLAFAKVVAVAFVLAFAVSRLGCT